MKMWTNLKKRTPLKKFRKGVLYLRARSLRDCIPRMQGKVKSGLRRNILRLVSNILQNSQVKSKTRILFRNKIIRILIPHKTYMQLTIQQKTRPSFKN